MNDLNRDALTQEEALLLYSNFIALSAELGFVPNEMSCITEHSEWSWTYFGKIEQLIKRMGPLDEKTIEPVAYATFNFVSKVFDMVKHSKGEARMRHFSRGTDALTCALSHHLWKHNSSYVKIASNQFLDIVGPLKLNNKSELIKRISILVEQTESK
jgi:hypothetical protein